MERRRWTRGPFGLLVVIIGMASLVVAPRVESARQGTPEASALRTVACPFAAEVAPFDVECGLLVVPEDRSMPAGNMIALSVVTVRNPNPEAAAEPVLYLEGGPGIGAFGAIVPLLNSDAGSRLVAERDLIVLDQRGTGYSVPRLDCTLFTPDRLTDTDRYLASTASCFDRFTGAGVGLGSYTTVAIAADARDLRLSLGLDEWNVYGVSYGTTIALELLRRDPSGTRALVLDSPSPPQSNEILDDVRYKAAALEKVFAECAADPGCGERHPDLEVRFGAAIEALNAGPLDLGDVRVTGDFLVFVLTNTAFFTGDLIPRLPDLIDGALSGDVVPLADLLSGVGATDDGTGAETAAFVASDKLFLAVTCAEEAPRTSQAELGALAATGPVAASLARTAATLVAGCASWDVPPVDPDALSAVSSDAPVLILVGEWDPSTPLALAAETATTLPNARIVEFPGQAHGVVGAATTACPFELMASFWVEPSAPVDRGCVDADYASISFAIEE